MIFSVIIDVVNVFGSDESKLFNELCLGEHARVDEWSGEMIIGEKILRNIVFITACGAGVSAISSPEGMGPNPVEDGEPPGRVAVLTEWRQKGARCLAPQETV